MKKIFNWSILLFVFSIPLFPILINVKLLILALAVSIIVTGLDFNFAKFFAQAWDFVLYLLVLIFGLSYSADVDAGLSVLETNFSFLAIPIIFSCYRDYSEIKLKAIFYSFTMGLFAACLVCLANAVFKYYVSGNPNVFFFYELTGIIDSHPTYFAYYLISSITFGLYTLNNENQSLHHFFAIVSILFLFFVLLLTGGQTAFISLLLVCSFFLLKFILNVKESRRKLTAALVTIMMAGMFVVSAVDNSDRGKILNDSWDRLSLWKAAIKANPDFIFGVGTGDYKKELNEYYKFHGLEEYAKINSNSHNQLIQIFFSNGIIGLLTVLIFIGRPLYFAIRDDHALGILIFFPFLIYGMTEVFLGRYQGVVFFALMHQVFVTFYNTNRPSFSLKTV